VSEPEAKEPSRLGDHPAYGEAPGRPEADSWDRSILPMLWFIIPFNLVVSILKKWLPWYQAMGIGCFVAGLVAFRVRGLGLRHYGFGRYLLSPCLCRQAFLMLAFALDALVSGLFR